ncbi:MAG: redoxin domain-containing protein [Armatimonadetes bacterium]|nr:redoxin domain-containing protein [Armatimonadota bacterium]
MMKLNRINRSVAFLGAVAAVALFASGCGDDGDEASASTKQEKEIAVALTAIDAIAMPVPDESQAGDQAYVDEYNKNLGEVRETRGDLIKSFYKEYPDHERIAGLLDSHWGSYDTFDLGPEEADRLAKELEQFADETGNDDARQNARYWQAVYLSIRDSDQAREMVAHASWFANEYPEDERAAILFMRATTSSKTDFDLVREMYARVSSDYPRTGAGQDARRLLTSIQYLGETFKLDFPDAITGKRVTTESLKGKVVVLDFWATWCDPCVDAAPYMKDLYEYYKDRGLEIVGLSLDDPVEQGGLENVRLFVEEFGMTWPQYHMNDDPTLTSKYGIQEIPRLFLLDKEGRIRSVDATLGLIGGLIEELLAE